MPTIETLADKLMFLTDFYYFKVYVLFVRLFRAPV